MAEVFLCKKGQLTGPGKHDLRQAGVVVVEVDDPTSCQFIRSSELVSGDAMLWAAMDALKQDFGSYDHGNTHRERFAMNVAELVQASWKTGGSNGQV